MPVTETQATAVNSELRALRALWYSILCDTHGNVPIVISYSDEVPKQNTRIEVYNFIISELTAVLPNLPEVVDKTTYGRLTQWSAWQLLARMYLNAEVYKGSAEWAKCIEACDKVITSGKYVLESDYKNVFKVKNEASKEIVSRCHTIIPIMHKVSMESAYEAIVAKTPVCIQHDCTAMGWVECESAVYQ